MTTKSRCGIYQSNSNVKAQPLVFGINGMGVNVAWIKVALIDLNLN